MKAVVVEIKDGYAAVLQEDGMIVKLKNNHFTIGDVVIMRQKAAGKKFRFHAIMAVAVMFVMLLGTGVWAYTTPYYYVSMDVNPSIMLRVNMFERVIGMEAVNEDAANVLADLDLNNKDVKDAIAKAVERLTELGYLDGEDDNILIASSAKNDAKAERLAGKLKGAAEEEIAENGMKAKISAGALNYEMIQQAKDMGITPGKFNIIVNLLNGDVNELKDESVKDLMARFTAAKRAQGKGTIEDEDLDDPAENASLREQNAAGKAGQAGKKEGNAPVGTPATENKAPNANSMENNVTDDLADDEGTESGDGNKPEISNKPETPVGRP